jgi:hypothetical protein
MRTFNPFAMWSQVPLANRTASVIKSIQHVASSGSLSGTGSTIDITITSVDTAKAFIIPGNVGAIATAYGIGLLKLTSATNVRLDGGGSGSGYPQTINYSFDVVEFY